MRELGWLSIIRLGLVQTALGSIVVLTTSTLNRVMVVELSLAAVVPGVLVGIHSALQISRPLWGHASDRARRRTPWIIGGMAVLAVGGSSAAWATRLMASDPAWGIAAAVLAYVLVGIGVGSAGTSLLALLAERVRPGRKAAAASIVWLMMIAGFIVTTVVVGGLLEPFSFDRLVGVCSGVAVSAFVLTCVVLQGVERGRRELDMSEDAPEFRRALAEVWSDSSARAFTVFVFVSMLAYNTQDLILEPFAGVVFGMSPGASTRLSSVQHGGVLVGMVLVALAASGRERPRLGSAKIWTVIGCVSSGAALFGLAMCPFVAPDVRVLRAIVGLMGFSNGAFAVAAIGWMMSLASAGRPGTEGLRMGLWGGAQAIAFALGGFAGTLGVDLVRYAGLGVALPYATVFFLEAALFLFAATLASAMSFRPRAVRTTDLMAAQLVDGEALGDSIEVRADVALPRFAD